jgi:hypothetical protein
VRYGHGTWLTQSTARLPQASNVTSTRGLQRIKIVVRKYTAPSQDSKLDQPVPCAHEDCNISALCRIKTKTGWANLCWQHYDAHFAEQAIDNLSNWGMEIQPDETREEHVQRMREFVKTGFKRMAKSNRINR